GARRRWSGSLRLRAEVPQPPAAPRPAGVDHLLDQPEPLPIRHHRLTVLGPRLDRLVHARAVAVLDDAPPVPRRRDHRLSFPLAAGPGGRPSPPPCRSCTSGRVRAAMSRESCTAPAASRRRLREPGTWHCSPVETPQCGHRSLRAATRVSLPFPG